MGLFSTKIEKGNHVSGINKGKILMYGLSTCVWCKKTKALLTELGVEFDYVYVDRLEGEEKAKAIEEIKQFNPSLSFPTTLINEKKAIVGFKEKEIKEALGF